MKKFPIWNAVTKTQLQFSKAQPFCVRAPWRQVWLSATALWLPGAGWRIPWGALGCSVGEKWPRRTKVTQLFLEVWKEGAFAYSVSPHCQPPMWNNSGCGEGEKALLNGQGIWTGWMQLNTAGISIRVLCLCRTVVGRAKMALYRKGPPYGTVTTRPAHRNATGTGVNLWVLLGGRWCGN